MFSHSATQSTFILHVYESGTCPGTRDATVNQAKLLPWRSLHTMEKMSNKQAINNSCQVGVALCRRKQGEGMTPADVSRVAWTLGQA